MNITIDVANKIYFDIIGETSDKSLKVILSSLKFLKLYELNETYITNNVQYWDKSGNIVECPFVEFWRSSTSADFRYCEKIDKYKFNDKLDIVLDFGKYKGKTVKYLVLNGKFNYVHRLSFKSSNAQVLTVSRYWVTRILGEQSAAYEYEYNLMWNKTKLYKVAFINRILHEKGILK